MKLRTLATTSIVWLTTASLSLAHHLPPEMEEVDEFGTETLRSQLLHPFTGLDHWLLAIGVLSWIVLAHRFLTKRNATKESDPLASTNKSASLLGMMKRRSETALTPR